MLTAKKITKWETSDGVIHSSEEMARAYVLNAEVCELFEHLHHGCDPQDIVNILTSNMKAIRAFFDATEAMERKVMES